MKVGNVISSQESDISYFNEDFNIVNSFDGIYNDLPTLIIGWDKVKEYYPENEINALDRYFGDEIYWTFHKTEMRKEFQNDCYDFINYCYEALTRKAYYVFVDPIQYKLDSIKKIYRKIQISDFIVSYIGFDKSMIYISVENYVMGIDLKLLDWMGISKDKTINKVRNISNVFIQYSYVQEEYENFLEHTNNDSKYIPYIFKSKNHGQG